MTLVKFTSVPRAKLGVSLSLQLFSLGPTEFATLRLRGRLGRDGCQVHCGTVLRHAFSTLWQICQNSLTMHFHDQLDPVSRATSKWRIQHADKWDIQSKQRAIQTLPNKRTTLRLLLFFIRWYLLIVRDYHCEWWFHDWWTWMSHLHRLHRPAKPKIDWQACKDPLKSWEQRINLRYLLH